MGRTLDIIKLIEEDGVYYYEVDNCQLLDPTRFFIAINAQKKTVSYFVTLKDVSPIVVIDFNQANSIIPVFPWDKGLASSAFFLAGVQAYKATRDNHFPNSMGLYS